jgi:hypothetical protein
MCLVELKHQGEQPVWIVKKIIANLPLPLQKVLHPGLVGVLFHLLGLVPISSAMTFRIS